MRAHPTDGMVERAFPKCSHPDCGGAGQCATDRFHLKARVLARLAYLSGKRAARKTAIPFECIGCGFWTPDAMTMATHAKRCRKAPRPATASRVTS